MAHSLCVYKVIARPDGTFYTKLEPQADGRFKRPGLDLAGFEDLRAFCACFVRALCCVQ